MDPFRGRGVCRRFLNGSCRFGSRCNYQHERRVVPSAQICRYFQKGGCWYGDHCRYLHILQPEVDAAVAARRSSAPTVVSPTEAYTPPYRRGSEPAVLQAGVISTRQSTRPEFVVNVSDPQLGAGPLAADIPEEQPQGTDSHPTASHGLGQSSEGTRGCDGRKEQETSSNGMTEDGAVAAASSTQGTVAESDAFLQSKNVTCGICMDKVYEKTEPRNRVFGLLPNCNHSFCLPCIMTWRKTKDLGPDVVKSCPQCRVRSAFYVPNKYWVEGQVKERIIVAFKEKFSKRSCIYYTRFGCCPFRTECLYRHDKHFRRRHFLCPTEEYDGDNLLDFIIAMTLLAGDEDDEDDDFSFYFTED